MSDTKTQTEATAPDGAGSELTPLLERALSIIEGLTHPDEIECRLDHHGYCQEHSWFETDPPCPVKRAKALFEELGRAL